MGVFVNSKNENKTSINHAIAYYRLSKYDGNCNESDSISNQRKLILNYISTHDEIELVEEAYDDGYTGTNFQRPGFISVIDAIDSGKANCVIVKDLSRLGREYIETGKYLEMIFPEKGVRFISINDDYDSDNRREGDEILIPFKNIMNEVYCRELSKKLRKQFRIQRSRGEFLGAFACYGYLKDPKDKHKLIIDEYAAEVVRSIFEMKLKGLSMADIADRLNEERILSPSEYKKSLGMNYKSGFKTEEVSKWGHMTVRSILTNAVYKGDLVQGKRGTPNYKLKNMRYRKEDEWVVVKNNHDAIIDTIVFESVQKLLQRDTRKSPGGTVQNLAGFIYCGDCKYPMHRRSVKRGRKEYHYYICSQNQKGKGCSSHNFEQGKLEQTVLSAIRHQIMLIVEVNKLLGEINNGSIIAAKLSSIDRMIAEKDREIDENQEFRMKLYEALTEKLISYEEYDYMRKKYAEIIASAQSAVRKLREERESLEKETSVDKTWIGQFLKYENITELSREAVVTLVDRIEIFEDKSVKIKFNYHDEFEYLKDMLNCSKQEVSLDGEKEPVLDRAE